DAAPCARRGDRGPSGGDRAMIDSTVDSMAVLVVRDGLLPLGADEAVAEAGGLALVAGQGTKNAAAELTVAERAWLAELPASTPGTLAGTLAPVLAEIPVLLLPASPDGRDLAPRLAHALNRPLLAEAITVTATGAEVLRWGGRALVTLTVDGPFVATLHPGTRGVATE